MDTNIFYLVAIIACIVLICVMYLSVAKIADRCGKIEKLLQEIKESLQNK